jgi:hypothetical protein
MIISTLCKIDLLSFDCMDIYRLFLSLSFISERDFFQKKIIDIIAVHVLKDGGTNCAESSVLSILLFYIDLNAQA